jgi:hypothetical protein
MITVPEGVKTKRYREMESDSCPGQESLYGGDQRVAPTAFPVATMNLGQTGASVPPLTIGRMKGFTQCGAGLFYAVSSLI